MPHGRRGRAAIAVAFLLTAIAACDQNSTATPSTVHDGADSGHSLLSDEFTQFSADLIAVATNLAQTRIAGCMNDKGFDYQPQLAVRPAASQDPLARYGVIDPEVAARRGYMPVQTVTPSDPETETYPTGPEFEAYISALQGQAEDRQERTLSVSGGTLGFFYYGGCSGRANDALFGDVDGYFEFFSVYGRAEDFANRSGMALQDSPEFAAVNTDWATCMSSSDEERFESPQDVGNYSWIEPRPSAEEKDVATADAICKHQVSYVERARAVELNWQEEHAAEIEADLIYLREMYARLTEFYDSDLGS